tara:strand:- start:122 stop:412 length:291 start_codon:yes stop_codon:yes gene_type:complete
MNIDQAMFLRQEKIRRFPQSRLAKMDRFMQCPVNRKLVYGLQKRKHWSEFASNLLSFFEKTGFLTTKQCVVGNDFVRKQDERDAERAAREVEAQDA